MEVKKIKNKYSKIISDYLNGDTKLDEFYAFKPNMLGLEKALRSRQFTIEKRKILAEALKYQYYSMDTSEQTNANVSLIEHTTTYTITTGHQLSLATGPLYFIYKIISTIKLTQELKKRFPLYDFVPVYWMASEDHDFEEINHFHLFNKKIQWNSEQKGAVGEFKLKDIDSIFSEFEEDFGIFKDAYLESNSLAEATLLLVNELFKAYGLVIVEPNNKHLKKIFAPIIKDELIKRESNTNIENTNTELSKLDYKIQVTPRLINLFYIDKQLRERIIFEDNIYKINNTDLSFSEEDILNLVDSNPEKFSPNVVLRPVFQEDILPNLAYIGGPGEIAYWLQLKSNFDRLGVFFPALLLRDSFLILNKSSQKVINKLELELEDLFKDVQSLKKELVKKWSDGELKLHDELTEIEKIVLSIKEKTDDKSLYPAIEAEFAKISKGLGNLEKRIHKAEERKHETALNQLEKLKEKLFPNGAPQERHENVLNYYINDKDFIAKIFEYSDVLDNNLKVLFQ